MESHGGESVSFSSSSRSWEIVSIVWKRTVKKKLVQSFCGRSNYRGKTAIFFKIIEILSTHIFG